MALSIGGGLTQIVTVLAGVFMARLLSRDDLATYRQTFLALNFVLPFLSLGLPTAIYYFVPRYPGEERTVLVACLVVLCATGAIFSGFLLLGGDALVSIRFNNPQLASTLKIAAIYPLLITPLTALEACLVISGRIQQLVYYNLVSRGTVCLALVVTCWLARTADWLVIVQVTTAACFLGPGLFFMARALQGGSSRPQLGMATKMLRHSLPLGLAGMLGTVVLQCANIIVSAMCTPAEFAVYSVGAMELPLIGVVTGSLTTVIMADMARFVQGGNKAEALQLFQTAAIRSATVLLPTMVFLMVTASALMEGLYSPKYSDSAVPFRAYLVLLPIRIVSYGAALVALGMSSAILMRSIIEVLLAFVLCISCVSVFGYLGAPLGLALVLYLWSVPFNLVSIARAFQVPVSRILPLTSIAKIFGVSLLCCPVAGIALPLSCVPVLLRVAIGAGLYGLAVIVFLRLLGLAPWAHPLQAKLMKLVGLSA